MMFGRDNPKMLPLVEGKCPPVYDAEKNEYYYPEPDPDYKDPELVENERYSIEDKDEFYGYITVCKACGVKFQAFDGEWISIRNYCPGCGRNLLCNEG